MSEAKESITNYQQGMTNYQVNSQQPFAGAGYACAAALASAFLSPLRPFGRLSPFS